MSPDCGGPTPEAAIETFLSAAVLPSLAHALEGPPEPLAWRRAAAALAARIEALPIHQAIPALRALDPAGSRLEALCRAVLLPAAARLRAAHDPDALDQCGYLAALWRLRMCLIGLDDRAEWLLAPPPPAGAVLTLDPHTHGPSVEHAISVRFLARDGWGVRDCDRGTEQGCDSVHDEPYDAAWLSLDAESDLAQARRMAEQLRRASRNPAIRLLGGGTADLPDVPAAALGLDGIIRDATGAPRLARRLALA